MPTLREVREGFDLTVEELSELSGISMSTIHRIESGDNTYKVNQATADALADALYYKTYDIFHPTDLSHLGRPPMTGKSLRPHKEETHYGLCPHCHLEAVKDNHCLDCDRPVLYAVS